MLSHAEVIMRSFWVDPYFWIHLAGLAAVPIFLEFCLLGLSLGEPVFPAWLELGLVGGIGILPILWMQWQRPFSIFSLLVLTLKPSQLTEDQRRILSLFKSSINRILAVLVAIAMAWLLWQLYQITPIVSPGLIPGIGRTTALLVAALAFFGANLFLQIPVSVLSVLSTSNRQFAATAPYPVEQIRQAFTIPGIRVNSIVPPLFSEPVQPKAAPPVPVASPAVKPSTPAVSAPESAPESAPAAPVSEPYDLATEVPPPESPQIASSAAAPDATATSSDPIAAPNPDLYSTTNAQLLRESQPLRLSETAASEDVPIAESVVEHLVNPAEADSRTAPAEPAETPGVEPSSLEANALMEDTDVSETIETPDRQSP
jgi:hypothetical protein